MPPEIFDIEAALKKYPEAEVAEYLAEQHGIDRNEYLKTGKTDADFLKEMENEALPQADVAQTPAAEAAPAQAPAPETLLDNQTDGFLPAVGGAVGAGLGTVGVGGNVLLKKAGNLFSSSQPAPVTQAPAGRSFASPVEVSARSMRNAVPVENYLAPDPHMFGSTSDVYNWAQGKRAESGQYANGFLGGRDMEHESALQKLRAQVEAHDPMMTVLPGTNGMIGPKVEADRIREDARMIGENRAASAQNILSGQQQAAADAAAMRAARLKAQQDLIKAGAAKRMLPETVARIARSGPVVGGLAGYNAVDMLQQGAAGNVPGAALSGLGALGAGAQKIKPLPPRYKALGMGTALLAPLVNRLTEHAEGGEVQHFADGRGVSKLIKAGLEAFTPTPTRTVKFSEAIAPHEGKYLNVTQADRMRSTQGDLGGPGFSKFQLEDPRYAAARAAWGVTDPTTASRIININKRYPEGKAIWAPLIGSEKQHRSNLHVYDMLTDEFNRKAASGNLSDELRRAMNERLTTWKGYIDKKTGKPFFPSDLDVGNPEHLADFGSTFNRRAAIAEVLGGKGVGGRKGQIFDYPDILSEMTDPMTVGAPTHSVGTRLFTLSNETEHLPELHSAFPQILKGQDQGVVFAPAPKEVAIPSWLQMFEEFKGRKPGFYDLTGGAKEPHIGTPFQFIDEPYIRRAEDLGFKEGGKIDAETMKSLFE